MLERCADDWTLRIAKQWFAGVLRWFDAVLLLILAATPRVSGAPDVSILPSANAKHSHYVTNAAQFRSLAGTDFLAGCDFHLSGVITLVDTNRDLLVLQDATGAVAINCRIENPNLRAGQLATVEGVDCYPYFAIFPEYPCRPSGTDVRASFEAPSNWGHYYLTRMRGWLRPPVTGQYRFWIASDNSSELWLSTDGDPSKARKIAFILRFNWASEREWSRFPSQHSETMLLKAGETYYVEALQEQKNGGDHLSVAWEGPSIEQSIIDGGYLTPWNDARLSSGTTNGILREVWTNYSSGDLTRLEGARPFESAITVKKLRVNIHAPGPFPNADRVTFDRSLRPEDNYRWAEAEGIVQFAARAEGDGAFLDLSDGQSQIRVHLPQYSPDLAKRVRNLRIRVQGVCEGVYDSKGNLVPGLIWTPADSFISVIDSETNNPAASLTTSSAESSTITNRAWQGFYGTRCVVTFNDKVLGNDFIFAQQDSVTMRISLPGQDIRNRLRVGHWVDLQGDLQPGKYFPVITPLVVTELGEHFMPLPISQPFNLPIAESPEGRWSELEGVVHRANTNGLLWVAGKDWHAHFWIGQTSSNLLASYVDATLRARGVLLMSMLDAPVLLIPSSEYLDVEEQGPDNAFSGVRCAIVDVLSESREASLLHRVRVAGVVTYCDDESFVIQDASAGIRVRAAECPGIKVGQAVEVAAFPTMEGFDCRLTDAVVRPANPDEQVRPKVLDFGDLALSKQSCTLVHVTGTLLNRTTNATGDVLELQQQQRVFLASMASGLGTLPKFPLGSRLSVTGVLDNETTSTPKIGDKLNRMQFLASLNIQLRSPQDVAVVRGPPWWTLRRTATLVGTLLTVLMVALLWVYLLRRRLERQQAAQMAFSRNVLERLEEERRRIAANLHDSLGQMLLVIKNQAIWATQGPQDEPEWQGRLDEIGNTTSQAIEEVRRITYGLRPYQLDRLGLTQAIRTLIDRASENSSVIFASRVADIDKVFEKDNEIHVYRIVQEAVNNILKHSGATEAAVVIKKRSAAVSISIRDNGRGFDPAQPSTDSHDIGYGLKGIAERVRILGGTWAIDSRPNGGTSTTVEIPLSISKHDAEPNSTNS